MRPEGVNRAIHEGRHDILSAMGKKGAEKAAESKRLQGMFKDLDEAALAKERQRLAEEQAKLYRINPEGDVLPPDEILPLEG